MVVSIDLEKWEVEIRGPGFTLLANLTDENYQRNVSEIVESFLVRERGEDESEY